MNRQIKDFPDYCGPLSLLVMCQKIDVVYQVTSFMCVNIKEFLATQQHRKLFNLRLVRKS